MSMFLSGQEKLATLANLIDGFRRMRTSFLHAAMVTDVEMYELNLDRPSPPPSLPEHIDETAEVVLLRTISEQLQALAHYGAHQTGRPKIRRLPRPQTAEDMFVAREASAAFAQLESRFKFVPVDEFQRTIAEHEQQGE